MNQHAASPLENLARFFGAVVGPNVDWPTKNRRRVAVTNGPLRHIAPGRWQGSLEIRSATVSFFRARPAREDNVQAGGRRWATRPALRARPHHQQGRDLAERVSPRPQPDQFAVRVCSRNLIHPGVVVGLPEINRRGHVNSHRPALASGPSPSLSISFPGGIDASAKLNSASPRGFVHQAQAQGEEFT